MILYIYWIIFEALTFIWHKSSIFASIFPGYIILITWNIVAFISSFFIVLASESSIIAVYPTICGSWKIFVSFIPIHSRSSRLYVGYCAYKQKRNYG